MHSDSLLHAATASSALCISATATGALHREATRAEPALSGGSVRRALYSQRQCSAVQAVTVAPLRCERQMHTMLKALHCERRALHGCSDESIVAQRYIHLCQIQQLDERHALHCRTADGAPSPHCSALHRE